ncbi:hypothetical protein I4U23_010176 [Adineta vaga]|nr:hypothetical protein I4U23_010176 [Adineta vaga]
MLFYQIWKDEFQERIIPLQGDLSKPRFGLDNELYEALANEVDIIYHCAAAVNFILPYSKLYDSNVRGTYEIIHLATYKSTCIPVHYISTISVLSNGINDEVSINQISPNGLNNGYAQSKWVSEKLITRASDLGLPVVIYRLGSICASMKTGACNRTDLHTLLFSAMMKTSSYPYTIINSRFQALPVDFTAKSIVYLSSLQPDTNGKVYHILNPNTKIVFADIIESMYLCNIPLEHNSLEEWQIKLKTISDQNSQLEAAEGLLCSNSFNEFHNISARQYISDVSTAMEFPSLDHLKNIRNVNIHLYEMAKNYTRYCQMDAYWELSDFDIHIRQQGLEKLLESLKTSSTDNEDETNSSSQLEYTMSRLIKGLVSNRKCARIGYAATLGTLASLSDTQMKVPSTDEFISSIQNKLTTKKETGVEDAKNVRIGRVLSYIALAYTEKDNNLSSVLGKIIPDLLLIRTQETRRRLRTFIDASIIQLAKWSDRKLFKKGILSRIQELLPTTWQMSDDGSKSIFLLISLVNLYPKIFDQEYFQLHWKTDVLPLGKTNEEQAIIKKCLQSFDNELHLLEQLSKELLIYAIHTQQLATFWPILVDELSNIGLDSNKGHILLDLITFCFQEHENFDPIYIIETILDQSQALFSKILDLLSSAGRKTYQQASVQLSKDALDKLAHTIASRPLQERLRLFEKLLK